MNSFEVKSNDALLEFIPKESKNICPLAKVSLETTELSAEISLDSENNTVIECKTTAVVTIKNRRGLIPLVVGKKHIENLQVSTRISDNTNKENFINRARAIALAEVLFQHLATNCLECPLANFCPERKSLAEYAHDLQSDGLRSSS